MANDNCTTVTATQVNYGTSTSVLLATSPSNAPGCPSSSSLSTGAIVGIGAGSATPSLFFFQLNALAVIGCVAAGLLIGVLVAVLMRRQRAHRAALHRAYEVDRERSSTLGMTAASGDLNKGRIEL